MENLNSFDGVWSGVGTDQRVQLKSKLTDRFTRLCEGPVVTAFRSLQWGTEVGGI